MGCGRRGGAMGAWVAWGGLMGKDIIWTPSLDGGSRSEVERNTSFQSISTFIMFMHTG